MDFNYEPFWDDFEASNGAKDQNYMRILFRPGYAVQARELTQIQSIIQDQIKQFGDHIFKNGSPVYGGHISLDTSISYLKLQTTYSGADIDLQDFDNKVIFNASGSAKIRAKVVSVDETQTQPTLMIRYLRGTPFPASNVVTTSSGSYAQVVDTSPTGFGSVASIDTGVFYVDGYFVHVAPQSIVLDAYGSAPTYKVGLEINDEVIDESADANLLDPAQSSFNYQAPGAHRYKFALNLSKRALDSVDDSRFFELLRVENGVITKQINYPIYSELEKTLARRTNDESGDYVVKDFSINISANANSDSNFIATIGPGKAYVKGFEYETIGNQRVTVSKARTSNTSTDYDLSLEYGNYLYVGNLAGSANGLFNISKLQTLELHCVPRASINTTGTQGYNTTYMGTAKVLNFDRDSSTEYLLYLTDVNLVSNTVTAASTGASNTIVFPSHYSSVDGAYSNVSVRVLTGNSAGDVRKIVSYTGSTRTANVDANFSGLVGSGNTVSLLYNTRDIDSIVEVISTKAAFNVAMDVSTSSKDVTNATTIYDPNFKSLIFKLPEGYIANNSITNADYIARKFLEGRTSSGSGQFTLTLSGNETFPYGSDGNALSATSVLENIIIMASSSGGTVTAGQIVTPTSVVRDSSTQLTISTGSGASFTADIYITVKINNSEQATNNRRTKTLRGNSAITTLRSTDAPTNGSSVIGASSVKIDSSNGFIWFTDASAINKTPGANNSLYIPDVFKIVKIYDSGSKTQAPTSSVAVDVTNNYYLDPGQNLNYYDHSKIVLAPGAPAPTGQLVAMVQYYEHSTSINGYFDVDSYPTAQYANGSIPIFATSDGTQYNLRDCIDFRLTRQIGTAVSVASYDFVEPKTPKPSEPMELTYSYYLPRKDKIVVTKDKELKVISGISSKNPALPPDSEDAMTLFSLDIQAYTANPNNDVTVTTTEHKRYTMKDISNLETRIENLEYYSMLSLSESKAQNKTLLYEGNATQKEKYGTIVDNFSSFAVANYQSLDFSAAIDDNKLSPANIVNNIQLDIDQYNPSLIKINDKNITLAYTEVPAITQSAATSNVAIAPYVFGQFNGSLGLTPETDSWFSLSLAPEIITTNQAAYAFTDPVKVIVSQEPKPTTTSEVVKNAPVDSREPVATFQPAAPVQTYASKPSLTIGAFKAAIASISKNTKFKPFAKR
jgi:hypothetical protein